ncbi:hypothetical protein [Cellvibrio sp.]|uniref:hypothetical protein n=1 Tax=Cellvibrio sp. TaxID=1965322 RepID=UPI003964766E
MLNTFTYLAYLMVSAYITLGVGRSLNRHGLVFLANHLEGNRRLAEAINGLLLIGYYLVNAGYILLVLNWNTSSDIEDLNDLIRFLSMKLGLVTLMLGAMHMVIFYVLANWKPVNIVTSIEEQ